MKSMQPPSAGIFFMIYFQRAGGVGGGEGMAPGSATGSQEAYPGFSEEGNTNIPAGGAKIQFCKIFKKKMQEIKKKSLVCEEWRTGNAPRSTTVHIDGWSELIKSS